ncbi:hypothetical protein TNCT_423251 [Trichonephila clavata]|uniref:Uncharacterized protein n=1 Tax=Trichonephila clavata TaxID=2740835 RepID=A0A8X6F0N6_TRICU|nr:hypothetical protein TNCT_423251 [Trichonephila clavata]
MPWTSSGTEGGGGLNYRALAELRDPSRTHEHYYQNNSRSKERWEKNPNFCSVGLVRQAGQKSFLYQPGSGSKVPATYPRSFY